MSAPRFRELDGLRGIAALAVVLSHVTTTFDLNFPGQEPPAFRFAEGGFGVQLFFLISGFVILMTARKSTRPSDFVIARVSRLYPVYWLALLCSTALILTGLAPAFSVTLPQFAANLTMVQRWFRVDDIDPVYWTLAVEMQFYVLMLLLILVSRSRLTTRLILVSGGAWIALALVVAVVAGPHSRGISASGVATPWKILLNITLAEFAPLFVAGCLTYLARDKELGWGWAIGASVAAVATGTLLHDTAHGLIVAGICAVFLLVCSRGRTGVLLWRPLQWLGGVSYSLYVFHSVPAEIVTNELIPFVGRNVAMLGAVAVVLVTAGILHQVGEVRGTRLMRRALLALRSRVDDRRTRRGTGDSLATP